MKTISRKNCTSDVCSVCVVLYLQDLWIRALTGRWAEHWLQSVWASCSPHRWCWGGRLRTLLAKDKTTQGNKATHVNVSDYYNSFLLCHFHYLPWCGFLLSLSGWWRCLQEPGFYQGSSLRESSSRPSQDCGLLSSFWLAPLWPEEVHGQSKSACHFVNMYSFRWKEHTWSWGSSCTTLLLLTCRYLGLSSYITTEVHYWPETKVSNDNAFLKELQCTLTGKELLI